MARYNVPNFITEDPISIPHRFSKKQDIEISGFIAAILAWGKRQTIIDKTSQFVAFMDNDPHNFVLNYTDSDLKPFLSFKHRTFNDIDALYFLYFFRKAYTSFKSLEDIFLQGMLPDARTVEAGIRQLRYFFINDEHFPLRTGKHVSSPEANSACKRINMFLRWMVRKDDAGVDFGIWESIHPRQLVCPCDLHVEKIARRLGLLQRKQLDWRAALELTEYLRLLDPEDPVKYDFALFGMGAYETHP